MKPHIIFLFSDQHNPDIMGWRGDPWVRTPNLDQLASDGTIQANCYCASPLCVPSRCSLMSTRLPLETGIFTNDQCLPSDRITFAHELGIAGYRTILAGRMHFKGPDLHHGFHERPIGDIGDPSFAGLASGKGIRHYKKYGGGHGVLEESAPGKSLVMAYDQAVVDTACYRLEQAAGEAADQPLFMTVGLYGPHNPYVCDPELFDYYYRTLPRDNTPPQSNDLHPSLKAYYKQTKMETPDAEAVHRSKAAYYGLVETLDNHLGRLRDTAREALGDNVIFIYASDHGDMAGSHGTFWKSLFYEGSVRVPMMWAGPGIPANQQIDTPTSLLDFGCSVISVAEGDALGETDGIDLWPAIQGKAELDPDRPIISQFANRNERQRPAAMIRIGKDKLVVHDLMDERPQLFDLETDPDEQNDRGIAPTAEDQALIDRLRARLFEQWNPAEADKAAKRAAYHMRRLWCFDSNNPFLTNQGWIGDLDEVREDLR